MFIFAVEVCCSVSGISAGEDVVEETNGPVPMFSLKKCESAICPSSLCECISWAVKGINVPFQRNALKIQPCLRRVHLVNKERLKERIQLGIKQWKVRNSWKLNL